MFEVVFEAEEAIDGDILLSLGIYNSSNVHLATLNTRNLGMTLHIHKGRNRVCFTIPRIPYYPDIFNINLYAEHGNSPLDCILDAFTFQVTAGSYQKTDLISQPYKALTAVDYSIEITE